MNLTESDWKALKDNPLFRTMEKNDILNALHAIDASVYTYEVGEAIMNQGDAIDSIGIVLSGALQIEKNGANGNRFLLAKIASSDFFGEALCFAGVKENPVSVICNEDARILALPYHGLDFKQMSWKQRAEMTEWLGKFLAILAQKNVYLQSRLEVISARGIRERINRFLLTCPKEGDVFISPFNRQEMADFLCVDRSALSRELSNWQSEGQIEVNKNRFRIL